MKTIERTEYLNRIKDRTIDIEIILQNENGLKIPNSAIVEKEFYLIPKEYAATDEKGNVEYFMQNKNVNYAEKTEKFAQMGKDVLDKIIKELDE